MSALSGAARPRHPYVPVLVRLAGQLHGQQDLPTAAAFAAPAAAASLSTWDLRRRGKARRERIVTTVWSVLLVVAVVGTLIALRRH